MKRKNLLILSLILLIFALLENSFGEPKKIRESIDVNMSNALTTSTCQEKVLDTDWHTGPIGLYNCSALEPLDGSFTYPFTVEEISRLHDVIVYVEGSHGVCKIVITGWELYFDGMLIASQSGNWTGCCLSADPRWYLKLPPYLVNGFQEVLQSGSTHSFQLDFHGSGAYWGEQIRGRVVAKLSTGVNFEKEPSSDATIVGIIDEPLDEYLKVKLANCADNSPVPNETVTFTLTQPNGANGKLRDPSTGQEGTSINVTTGMDGMASVEMIVGSKEGEYLIRGTYGTYFQSFTVEGKKPGIKICKSDNWNEELPWARVLLKGEPLKIEAIVKGGDPTIIDHITVNVKVEDDLGNSTSIIDLILEETGNNTKIYRGEIPNFSDNLFPPIINTFSILDNSGDSRDARVFERGMKQRGYTQKGLAIEDGNYNKREGMSTLSFLKSGGVEYMMASYNADRLTTEWRLVQKQGEIFFLSAHGYHDTGRIHILGESGEVNDATGASIGNFWQNDNITTVMVSGCSILDLYDPPYPGKKWVKIGPRYFLGYRGPAPSNGGRQKGEKIIEKWCEYSISTSAIAAWGEANRTFASGVYACAVDVGFYPNQPNWVIFYYLKYNYTNKRWEWIDKLIDLTTLP